MPVHGTLPQRKQKKQQATQGRIRNVGDKQPQWRSEMPTKSTSTCVGEQVLRVPYAEEFLPLMTTGTETAMNLVHSFFHTGPYGKRIRVRKYDWSMVQPLGLNHT